ncbi:MAG: 2-succinyl-6-hydroxy-2,4-cyclohexadiene-1-carboxylate synthase [Armatimonadetes bacterium]|nr:2-succinyl-6-hydroxy-2,4-cyclohexadiene-1-carboxylate synthase [Anaerolineae bacterium]
MNIALNGVNYHWIEYGSGDAMALLLLHGFTGSASNWAAHLPMLAQGRRVLALDLLGHDASDAPDDPARYSIEQAAADVVGFCDALGLGRCALLGYSMGGRLALYTALHYPQTVGRLILESASPGLATEAERAARRQSDAALAAMLQQKGVAVFVDYWERVPLFASRAALPMDVQLALRAQRLKNRVNGLANSLIGMGTGAQPSLWDILPNLHTPTLLLTGAQDAKFTGIARQMVALMTNAQHTVIADAGHTTHLEQPAAFDAALHRWLVY